MSSTLLDDQPIYYHEILKSISVAYLDAQSDIMEFLTQSSDVSKDNHHKQKISFLSYQIASWTMMHPSHGYLGICQFAASPPRTQIRKK